MKSKKIALSESQKKKLVFETSFQIVNESRFAGFQYPFSSHDLDVVDRRGRHVIKATDETVAESIAETINEFFMSQVEESDSKSWPQFNESETVNVGATNNLDHVRKQRLIKQLLRLDQSLDLSYLELATIDELKKMLKAKRPSEFQETKHSFSRNVYFQVGPDKLPLAQTAAQNINFHPTKKQGVWKFSIMKNQSPSGVEKVLGQLEKMFGARVDIDKIGITEISKKKLANYAKAAHKDIVSRSSSDSFTSGAAGDTHNRADPSAKELRRQQGLSRALDRLAQQDVGEDKDKCPPATQDIKLNLKNRQKAIDDYGYGPLNPALPNTKFWFKKVEEWNLDSVNEAKSSLCGNCAAFDQRQNTLDCIAKGIGDDVETAEGVIDAGDLGYCRFLKFKCASKRTCDAWVTGGPLVDKTVQKATVNEISPWDYDSDLDYYSALRRRQLPKGPRPGDDDYELYAPADPIHSDDDDEEDYKKGVAEGKITKKMIHDLADRRGIAWDNEPSFLRMTEKLTGHKHLDDLDAKQLRQVYNHIKNKQGVAEANSPEEFLSQIRKLAGTKQKFKVGDWVVVDPNETSGYASSGMTGRITNLYNDEGEKMAEVAVGGASGIQKKMKLRGGVFGPKGMELDLGKGIRSAGTKTSVPLSLLQKFDTSMDEQGVAEGTRQVKSMPKSIRESLDAEINNNLEENLHKWFKEKWVRFGPDGNIRGDCARGDDSEGKPKCLPQSKAHSLGKKGRASAAARKRRQDPNPERSGPAINVATKKRIKENNIQEFSQGGGSNADDYLLTLARAWYMNDIELLAHIAKTNKSLAQGMISGKVAVEKILARGIVCPDGKFRKYEIDFNGQFDGVELYTDDYFEHSDYGPNGKMVDGRTGKPWSPYEFIEFSDTQLGESLSETKKKKVSEQATVVRIDSKKIGDFAKSLKSYKHTDDWSESGLDTGDDSYWAKQNIKPNTSIGLFAGDEKRIALYATGNAHQTRFVEFTLNGKPTVYFDQKDWPKLSKRVTYLTTFDANNFKRLPTGEYFSSNPGTPVKQVTVTNPEEYIKSKGWTIKFTDDLGKVLERVKKLHAKGIIKHYGAEGMNKLEEKWSAKYKRSIDCNNPKGFSQRAHCQGRRKNEAEQLDELKCWSGYTRVKGVPAGAPGSCKKKTNEEHQQCPECGGPMFSELMINEKKDACYYKVKSRYKVWPSAYASGALVKCRKRGAKNWGSSK